MSAALAGASVVITGASSGIGRESSMRFAQQGASYWPAEVQKLRKSAGLPKKPTGVVANG